MPNYTVNSLHQAAWLVYINGLEIPVPSWSAQFGVWQMPTLTLDMIPHPILTRIGAEDRLQVALFYLDTHWDPDDPQFCLLGEFEVVGWAYNNIGSGQRMIQLQCVSQIQIFQQLYMYYISSMSDIVTSELPQHKTDAQSATTVKILYPASLFLEGLTSPESTKATESELGEEVDVDNFIKRPIEFVLNLFRALMWKMDLESDQTVSPETESLSRRATSVPGKNFFARWMNMTKFNLKWAALPVMEDGGAPGCFPIVKAVQDTKVLSALQQQIGAGIGEAGNTWDLLQQVYGYMYMEIAMIPSPPSVSVEQKTGIIKGPSVPGEKNNSIVSYFVKPQCVFAIPPACNVVFPSMLENFAFQENYLTQPTRMYMGESFISDVINQAKGGMVSALSKSLLATAYPPELKARMLQLVQSPESNYHNLLLFPEEFYKGPISKSLSAPPWLYMLTQQGTQPQDLDIASPLGKLFDKYAEYEYYRSRFAERSGGVSMAWNPYIVPGFPIAVFDQRASSFDVIGYANTVSLSGSASDPPRLSTSVGMTFVRTLPEFLGLVGRQTVLQRGQTGGAVYTAPFSTEDVVALATMLTSESGSQDEYERAVITWTALTRKLIHPNRTFKDIVTSGQGYGTLKGPDGKKYIRAYATWATPSKENLEFVTKVLSGQVADPTRGATNFAHLYKPGELPNYVINNPGGWYETVAYKPQGRPYTLKAYSPVPPKAPQVALSAPGNISPEENTAGTPPAEIIPDISPAEIIPDVGNAFQVSLVTEKLYRRLLYADRDPVLKKALTFNWREMINVKNAEGNIVDLTRTNFDNFRGLKFLPKPEYESQFESYDAAMQFVSRPVCTLKQYIEHWHGKKLQDLINYGTVRGEYRSFYSESSDRRKTKGAIFWGRIYKLTQGPGADPGPLVTNIIQLTPEMLQTVATSVTTTEKVYDTYGGGESGPVDPVEVTTTTAADLTPGLDGEEPSWVVVAPDMGDPGGASEEMKRLKTLYPDGFPQTRQDWDTILEEYRKIVRSESTLSPQG